MVVRFATILWVAFGCGCGSGISLRNVEGTVTFQGQPIENGEIRFIPVDGTPGPVSGNSITKGRYAAEGPAAVPIGSHRVDITAFRPAKAGKDDANIPFVPQEQFLPKKYNTTSELKITVPAGSGVLTHDFKLD